MDDVDIISPDQLESGDTFEFDGQVYTLKSFDDLGDRFEITGLDTFEDEIELTLYPDSVLYLKGHFYDVEI